MERVRRDNPNGVCGTMRLERTVVIALALAFAGGIGLVLGLGLADRGLVAPASAQQREAQRIVPPSRQVAQYSFSPIVRTAAPAVVNVYVRSRVQTFSSPFANDPFFRRFFGDKLGAPSERVQNSLGSGVIVTTNGLVVTNTHVVKASGETEIRIALSDKREFDAKVVLQDEKSDIAILKIEGGDNNFPALELEDSDNLEVGDMVLAIGNPFGVGQTVTSGIISALARTEVGRSDAQVFIQTDAAINPGNSGGALVDMSGRLVGINTMIFSQSGGSQGIGFAIPSNLVRLYVESAAQGRKVERPWIGARFEAVTREVAESLGLNRISGALVARISDHGPAADAGLEAGDVVTHVDGFEVADTRGVLYRLTTRGVGNTARLNILRKGRPQTLDLPLRAPPLPGRDDVRNLTGQHPLDGARVSNILPGIADEMNLDDTSGVVVVSVRNGSTAQRLGFQPRDIILSVGDVTITSVADLENAVASRQRMWQMEVKRNERILQLSVPG
jgi:Do/DeqQ family serine protease